MKDQDKETISRFMEPSPRRYSRSRDSEHGWWRWVGVTGEERWEVPMLGCFTLDRLHEVEARLTDEQWNAYVRALVAIMPAFPRYGEIVHATADQKTKALAAVLREGGKG